MFPNFLKGTVKEKGKGLYMMFLSREIDIKQCQIYTKFLYVYIYTILYRNSEFKQIIFSKYATNPKTIVTQVLSKYYFLIFIFIFNRFLIINDIIYKSVLRTSQELPPMRVQYSGHVSLSVSRDHYTALSLAGVLVTYYGLKNNIIKYIYHK